MKELFPEIPYLSDGEVTLKKLELSDADALRELVDDPEVYRYLPTFLYEKKYEDPERVIRGLYDECLEESLILGIFRDGAFCGLAEVYGYHASIHAVSVGSRLRKSCWGQGVASAALRLLVRYLYDEKEIGIVAASTMVENRAPAAVLEKLGFALVISGAEEDWGYGHPTLADKWIG